MPPSTPVIESACPAASTAAPFIGREHAIPNKKVMHRHPLRPVSRNMVRACAPPFTGHLGVIAEDLSGSSLPASIQSNAEVKKS